MTVGSDTLYFTYDASGIPLTVTHNGTTYYYATNLQGDIVAIVDANGTTVVTYTYDAWGNPLTTIGTMASTLGAVNPLRYRGYVYDAETGLYYLQSRYYNPEIGRFINADAFATTGQGFAGNNMFAYCGNVPTLYVDISGHCFFQRMINILKEMFEHEYEYILDQTSSSIAGERLGNSTVGQAGCGAVATYNARISMGIPASFDSVLDYYNKHSHQLICGGTLGMSPDLVGQYFEDLGYRVIITDDDDTMDLASKNAKAGIIYYMYYTYSSIKVCPVGSVSTKLVGHHLVEFHRISQTYYRADNALTNSGFEYFTRTSDYAASKGFRYCAILIFDLEG